MSKSTTYTHTNHDTDTHTKYNTNIHTTTMVTKFTHTHIITNTINQYNTYDDPADLYSTVNAHAKAQYTNNSMVVSIANTSETTEGQSVAYTHIMYMNINITHSNNVLWTNIGNRTRSMTVILRGDINKDRNDTDARTNIDTHTIATNNAMANMNSNDAITTNNTSA